MEDESFKCMVISNGPMSKIIDTDSETLDGLLTYGHVSPLTAPPMPSGVWTIEGTIKRREVGPNIQVMVLYILDSRREPTDAEMGGMLPCAGCPACQPDPEPDPTLN